MPCFDNHTQVHSRNPCFSPQPWVNQSEIGTWAWPEYTSATAWLLRQKALGPASPWAPFIASVPSYVPLPLTFPDSIVEQFEVPSMVNEVRDSLVGGRRGKVV